MSIKLLSTKIRAREVILLQCKHTLPCVLKSGFHGRRHLLMLPPYPHTVFFPEWKKRKY